LYHWGKTAFTTHMSGLGRLPLVGLPAEERRPSWLERAIYGFDRALRRWQSVVEFTGDPSCILRIRVGRLDRDVTLADGTSGRAGERFVDLHLWNEQVPAMPREGASIAWARQMHACFRQSLAQLARYLAERGDLNDISVVRCTSSLVRSATARWRVCSRATGSSSFLPPIPRTCANAPAVSARTS